MAPSYYHWVSSQIGKGEKACVTILLLNRDRGDTVWSPIRTPLCAARGGAVSPEAEPMRFTSVLLHAGVLVLAIAAPLAAQQGPVLATDSTPPASAAPAVFQLLRAQASLVQEAESAYHARVVATLPGWAYAVKDVERRTRLTWRGLPPVILLVPDGGRGFTCADREDTCLGRFQGVTLKLEGSDSSGTTMSSLILIAESARTRPDVWMHELTHALLSQHGLVAESMRHDRRYFAEERFVKMEL